MKKLFKRLFTLLLCAVVFSGILGIYYIFIYGSAEWQKSKELVDKKQIVFRIDGAFSSVERVAIDNALERWMEKTGRNVILTTFVGDVTVAEIFSWRSDGFATIYKASSWWSWKTHVARYSAGWDARGVAMVFSGDIFIMCDNKSFEDIVVHEVGYILNDKTQDCIRSNKCHV